MANAMAANIVFHANKTRALRKKAPEACGRCREKRIKCNGLQPCDQCDKRDIPCVFAYAPLASPGGQEALAEKLDLVLSRLDRIEEEMCRQASSTASNPDLNLQRQRKYPPERRSSGVAQLNEQTGCFEYYGQLDDVIEGTPPAKRRRNDPAAGHQPLNNEGSDSLGLKDLTGFCDYIVPLNDLRGDRYLREAITDRHLDSFFSTIHIFLPFLDPIAFRIRYKSLRQLFGDRRLFLPTLDDPRRPQFVCLLYAVLALGALYENERDDSSAWASWYFAEAQEMLGRLLNSSNIQLVQAAMLLGAYAQHTIKPNLAYILHGVATRLAFSTGLNVGSLHSSLGVDAQEARRTWWVIYIQEVELSLDAGRPMSLRTSDMNMDYPTVKVCVPVLPLPSISPTLVKLPAANEPVPDSAQSAEAYESSDSSPLKLDQREALRQEVEAWRASLPAYLRFPDFTERAYDNCDPNFLYNWKMRQQSSLQIHYQLTKIILLRGAVLRKPVDRHALNSQQLSSLHQSVYLDAARDMIRHIHKLFTLAPGLRRWSYYCFYCLQATLVLLLKVADDQHSRHPQRHAQNQPNLHSPLEAGRETAEEDRKICQLASEVFEFIKLKASQRCADVVRQFLDNRSSPGRRKRGPELSTPSSLVSGHAGLPQNGNSPRNTRDGPSGAESVGSVEGSSSTSPPISLNGLHDDLFNAFYRSDMSPAFNFSQPQPFLDTESPRNAPLVTGLEGLVSSDWMSGSMAPCANPRSPGWSIE